MDHMDNVVTKNVTGTVKVVTCILGNVKHAYLVTMEANAPIFVLHFVRTERATLTMVFVMLVYQVSTDLLVSFHV